MCCIPMATSGFTDSTIATHTYPPFTSAQLVQSFPCHDTIKLDDSNFVQWKQNIRLITDGYNLTGFLDGTLPVLPRFLPSPDGYCDVWTTATRLFTAITSARISRVRHELHSTKKGSSSVKEYIVKIQNSCALLNASGSPISETEKVEIVLAGLPSEFDAVLTLASFSSEPLPFQCLVEVLLKYKSRLARAV
ncbi:hypothetical protein J1N35_007343 [Gossypium stocksii]|uniref:Retrotransposon Copia-like N-terminal domain-containing protein n=1 Tax=Gossypium stocksii TaxID=47602 RepID=A0A9D3W8Z6_9ROSI|nr:hypothetical protein J1N35_007343 [Gossypium stocksii]